jgi:hypothetical protein
VISTTAPAATGTPTATALGATKTPVGFPPTGASPDGAGNGGWLLVAAAGALFLVAAVVSLAAAQARRRR